MNQVNIKAKTVEEAIELAAVQLGVNNEEVGYEIVAETKGLFGKVKGVTINAFAKQTEQPKSETVEEIKEEKQKTELTEDLISAKQFLDTVIEKMGISATVNADYDSEQSRLSFDIDGKDVGIIIGRHGETLDALQYLTNVVANKKSQDFVKITLDAQNYRAKRKETLINLANKTAKKAVKYARNMTIEPMNPYERRIIHETLQGYPDITTYSVGKEPNRKVVVAYNPGYSEEQED